MKLAFNRHPDDRGVDEILFVPESGPTVTESRSAAFMRLRIAERYKTSGLSGDEWRFSSALDIREHPTGDWVRLDAGYRDFEAHAAALYPALFGDFLIGKNQWLFGRKVRHICFAWKGLPRWRGDHEGKASDFLVACGHLPWALIKAGEDGEHHQDALKRLCCQPGCAEPHVSVYRKLRDYCQRCGSYCRKCEGRGNDVMRIDDRIEVRGFCAKHLTRGDCGLDDADANYAVVSGPGPRGNPPDPAVVSPSILGPTMGLES